MLRLFTDGCRFNILGSWPNGKALVDVYEHVLADYSNDASFTAVPDENTVFDDAARDDMMINWCNTATQANGTLTF
ncbi:hypothetical protein N7468_005681 [Penicillium chermesinum]|uniref:Uncharacterized protein n=1 Tax=Penicillium chermesinum TaxID=63820 RepID=A0A9W9P0A0_9EURO|nr:uncharacterized protein N7468_005681 [Penicillium chermesinum]KAJ5232725.1 hypothetical protein N7468_005681 [Penicillium chermesinum]